MYTEGTGELTQAKCSQNLQHLRANLINTSNFNTEMLLNNCSDICQIFTAWEHQRPQSAVLLCWIQSKNKAFPLLSHLQVLQWTFRTAVKSEVWLKPQPLALCCQPPPPQPKRPPLAWRPPTGPQFVTSQGMTSFLATTSNICLHMLGHKHGLLGSWITSPTPGYMRKGWVGFQNLADIGFSQAFKDQPKRWSSTFGQLCAATDYTRTDLWWAKHIPQGMPPRITTRTPPLCGKNAVLSAAPAQLSQNKLVPEVREANNDSQIPRVPQAQAKRTTVSFPVEPQSAWTDTGASCFVIRLAWNGVPHHVCCVSSSLHLIIIRRNVFFTAASKSSTFMCTPCMDKSHHVRSDDFYMLGCMRAADNKSL